MVVLPEGDDVPIVVDTCVTPPEKCEPGDARSVQLKLKKKGSNSKQLVRLGKDSGAAKGTISGVTQSGYYSIYDARLSESCRGQRNETGFLRITNSCNATGWPVERNVVDSNGSNSIKFADQPAPIPLEPFVILDGDNDNGGKDDCNIANIGNPNVCGGPESGLKCQAVTKVDDNGDDVLDSNGNPTINGACCVGSGFMGTFFLEATEDSEGNQIGQNDVFLHHWCPIWKNNKDLGFVVPDKDQKCPDEFKTCPPDKPNCTNNEKVCACDGTDSIHFRIAPAETTICRESGEIRKQCSGGCIPDDENANEMVCIADSCEDKDCGDGYCNQNGECQAENPCEDLPCASGACAHGFCLPNNDDVRGNTDSDGDGIKDLADCAPFDETRRPHQAEDCTDPKDNDCDGFRSAQDSDCLTAGGDNNDQTVGGNNNSGNDIGGGCGGATASPHPWSAGPFVLLLLFFVVRKRKEANTSR